jgi:hypothetical protein
MFMLMEASVAVKCGDTEEISGEYQEAVGNRREAVAKAPPTSLLLRPPYSLLPIFYGEKVPRRGG